MKNIDHKLFGMTPESYARWKWPIIIVLSLAISYPIARNGAPMAGSVDDSKQVAQREAISSAVNRCQGLIRAEWRYAKPTAGMAETIVESDRVIVRQPFKIGALEADAICEVFDDGRAVVSR